MTKKVEYSCNLCGGTYSSSSKIIGVQHDGKSLNSHHPIKCDTHICADCLEQVVRIVDNQKGSQERAIAP